jgi:hypothetical protein
VAEAVSLEGPVEIVDGELAIVIPLDAGGAVLAPFAKGIGQIDGEFLKVVIQPWLAEKLRIGAGSRVIVDNLNGNSPSRAARPMTSQSNDCRRASQVGEEAIGEER